MSIRIAAFAFPRCAPVALVALVSSALVACTGDDVVPRGFDGGQDGGASGDQDAAIIDGGGEGMGLLVAPEAEEVGALELDEPVTDVIYAEDLPIGLHADGGASILDLSDPTSPKILAALPSDGRIVGVAIDVQLRLLFVVTISGDLRVFRISDPSHPTQLTQLTLSEPGATDSIQGLVRVGYRLFVLGGGNLLPVRIQFGSGSSVSLLAEDPVALDADPSQIATGAGVVYVAFAGGKLQLWSATSSPAMLDQGSLGADVVGLIARGHRLFVALRGLGLRVVDVSVKGTLRVLFDAPELDDLEGLERLGNLVLVSLSRGLVVALDLSDITAPRALVSHRGALPGWIAAIGGNLVLGGGKSLSVLGVPPFVAASLPTRMASAFPRYGRVPLQLSKPIDPSTVTQKSVTLRCGSTAITGTLSVSLDNLRITFLPADTLPAGVTCNIAMQGVLDALGLPLRMPQQGVSFTTSMAAPAPIENPKSAYPHTADGAFTDWEPGKTDGFEYFDVTGAQGMYSRFYADFDGEQLWMLNDWFYDGDDIDPDCYNQFGVWTGGGSEWWEIRAYGDQRIEVRLNGALLADDDARVTGGYAFTATPNDPNEHTVYELGITTEPGGWGVQLHDPGPTFSCQQLETDPTSYAGTSTMDGSTIDPTQVPTMPEQPEPSVSGVGSDSPTLSWDLGQGAGAFTTYVIELSTGDDLSNVFFRTVVYGGTLVLPPGLLQPGTTYTVRLTAYNLVGSVSSDPYTFTVPGTDTPSAPSITSIKPSSVTQGDSVSVTITGKGFVQGARAYLDGHAVSTTYENGKTLIAMLTGDDTADVGRYDLTVRNVPGDDGTESNALRFDVTEPQSDVVGLEDLTPVKLVQDVELTITVTLSNAPDDTYTLVLAPSAGGDAVSFDCAYTDTDECQADVTLSTAGNYDAKIQVGDGQDAYDTNTIEDALTVNEPSSSCLHDECWPGGRLTDGCSACVTAVCAASATCCSTAWTSACVATADGDSSCSCSPTTLAASQTLSPSSVASNASAQVLVKLQNEPNTADGYTFTLILTQIGQVDGTAFACGSYNASQHTCTAVVDGSTLVQDAYHAAVQVTHTASGQIYLTPSIDSAFTVTAASSCAHSACWPGAALTYGCSTCVTTVCNSTQACCSTNWTGACVSAADAANATCTCTPPSIATPNSLVPNTKDYNANIPVVVKLQDEPNPAVDGYTFKLVLTGSGMGLPYEFDCVSYSSVDHTCTAQVSGMVQDTYDAALKVTHTASTQTYVSTALASAFTVTVPSLSCFVGGTAATATGSGDCSSPYEIDLSGSQVGTILTRTISSGDNYSFGPSGASCGWSTVRNDIYHVTLPVSAAGFEVSVDPFSDFNPQIAVLEDTCTSPTNICQDNGSPVACEVVHAVKDSDYMGTSTYFVVGVGSGNGDVTTRVRAF